MFLAFYPLDYSVVVNRMTKSGCDNNLLLQSLRIVTQRIPSFCFIILNSLYHILSGRIPASERLILKSEIIPCHA